MRPIFLLALLLLSPCSYAADAAPAAPLPIAPLATQLGATIQTLVNASAQPAATDDEDVSVADSFSAAMLDHLGKAVDYVKAAGQTLATEIGALPDFVAWLQTQSSDPRRQILWNAIGNDLLIAVGIPLLGGAALSFLLLPVRLHLRRGRPESLPARLGYLCSLFVLRSVPLVAFIGAALVLLNQNESHNLPRFVVLNVIYAVAVAYALRQILRGVFSPMVDEFRLFVCSKQQAIYAFRWLSAFSFIIVYGYFFVADAVLLHVPANAISLFQNIFGLVLTLLTIIVIFQTKAPVAALLRGTEGGDEHSFTVALRGWLARHWHRLVTLYLLVGLLVIWLSVTNGIALMLRGTLLTFALLAAARMGFVVVGYWAVPRTNAAALVHRQVLAFVLRLSIWGVMAVGIATVWGFPLGGLLASASGQKGMSAFLTIALTLFILTTIYEMMHAWIERYLNRSDAEKKPVASARARTLLPMVRNTVFIFFSAIAIVTCLSAVGFNIAPLLAGAGVVGVAIGFGSQTLVKDFLTGLFIVVENTIAVGDVVKIGDFSGSVEAMSIRTLRLRDTEGTLHILPFSEVSKISNMSKGFAFALVDVGVSYDSDLERVMDVLRDIGAQLQEDPVFKRVILEPIEVMGVEKLGDSTVTIRARMRTRPGKQWEIKRQLLLRIKNRFESEKIELPYPIVTHIMKG